MNQPTLSLVANDAGPSRAAVVNGVTIAYEVTGQGPPLLLIMGYRLSSIAWPPAFIEALARRFTVVTFDNRGTGRSGKPTEGYAIDNMARDACALLDHLGFAQAHVLGYSMGGAIAQEFVRQFPERTTRLVLCATMSGGLSATYSTARAQQALRDFEGKRPEDIARNIWSVTYSPAYLAAHRDEAERQMRREIANPTPLHAADLQYQALASFDTAPALPNVRCPTLVLTGDLDELVPPQNSLLLATLIPGATLVVMPGFGHRVIWEATAACADTIAGFLDGSAPPKAVVPAWLNAGGVGVSRAIALSTLRAMGLRFGDGKPVILVPGVFAFDLAMTPLAMWLSSVGYRPTVVSAALFMGREEAAGKAADRIARLATRLGRKAVVVGFDMGAPIATQAASRLPNLVSDLVLYGAAPPADVGPQAFRVRRLTYLETGMNLFLSLPQILQDIGVELVAPPAREATASAAAE